MGAWGTEKLELGQWLDTRLPSVGRVAVTVTTDRGMSGTYCSGLAPPASVLRLGQRAVGHADRPLFMGSSQQEQRAEGGGAGARVSLTPCRRAHPHDGL